MGKGKLSSKGRPKESRESVSDDFRVAVVSDLHAHDQDGDNAPSSLNIKQTDHSDTADPIAGLTSLIRRHNLSAHLLLCPGDLADKAKPEALQFAWTCISTLKTVLRAKTYFATAGNHDVDSRHAYNDFDAKGFLQQMSPRFPVDRELLFDKYWSRHFAISHGQFGSSTYRIVMLNSSAYHGEASRNHSSTSGIAEHDHGRISKWTLQALKEALAKTSPSTLNILVCHHPPYHQSEFDLGESDTMIGGQELLNLLGSTGEWFVVHGHKHHPKLSYAAGSSTQSPIVFAAGPLCASIWSKIKGTARNQFYLLSFPLHLFGTHGLVGRFQSWDWNPPLGWQPATVQSGLPQAGGFGCREKPIMLAARISQGVKKGSRRSRAELSAAHPELRFMTPDTLKDVCELLDRNHGISFRIEGGDLDSIERSL